jgi:apolipoprotein N-acyltransferase
VAKAAALGALNLLLRGPSLVAFGAGALGVVAFAPFGLFPLPLASLGLLFRLWRDATPREALRLGWLFGLGLMGFGVSWLHISINQFGNLGLPLALLATLGFIAVISGFFGLAGWLGARLTPAPAIRLLLAMPGAWGLVEWLRSWVLTGFPWLAMGYSQTDSPLAGFAPLLGVLGSGWLLALSAGAMVYGLAAPARRWGWLLAVALLWLAGFGLSRVEWTRPLGAPLRVALVQGNIPQSMKWDPSVLAPTLESYGRLSRAHWDSDLVVWPETAVPDFLRRVEEKWLKPLAQEAARHGTQLLSGVPVYDPEGQRYFNAAVVLTEPGQAYFKRHLVPFGEFLPLKGVLGPLLDFLEVPMSDFAAGDAARPLVRVGKLWVGVSICYEDAFGAEVRQALPDAAYLLNLSNDAWFGDSLAPHQHLQMARMRALETGRPLLRATNTGISALIDHRGRLLTQSRAFEQVVVVGRVQPMQGLTPYGRFGDWPVLALLLLALGLARVFRSRPRRPVRNVGRFGTAAPWSRDEVSTDRGRRWSWWV